MSKKVLLVDDSPMIHNLLRKSLEKNGYEICGDASNGQEAIELFQSLKPDLVFMDISMPIMDGITASKNIKVVNPDAKIIMLSAMGDDEILNQAKDVGVDIFLLKPFDEYKIISALAKVF